MIQEMQSINKMDRLSYIEAIRSIRLKCALKKLGFSDSKELNRIPVTQTPGVAGQKCLTTRRRPRRKMRHFRQIGMSCPINSSVQGKLKGDGHVECQPNVSQARRERAKQVREELREKNPYCTPVEGLTDKFRAALDIVDNIYKRYEQSLPLHQRPNTMFRQKAKVNQVLKNVLGPNESIFPTKIHISKKVGRDTRDVLDSILPAVPQLSFVEYVKNWKDIEFINILTRFKFQEIERIENDMLAEEETLNARRQKLAKDSTSLEGLLLTHEREATMATQKAHGEKMAAARKEEEVRALHSHVGNLHRALVKQLCSLDDKRLRQRFFFYISPVWWRVRHDYLHPVLPPLHDHPRLQEGHHDQEGSYHQHPIRDAVQPLQPSVNSHSGLQEDGLDQGVNYTHRVREERNPVYTSMHTHPDLQHGNIIQGVKNIFPVGDAEHPAHSQLYGYLEPKSLDQNVNYLRPVLPSLYGHQALQDGMTGDLVQEINHLDSVVQEEQHRPKTLYFQEPSQLLKAFENIENTNLGMIQDDHKTQTQSELLHLKMSKKEKQYNHDIAQLEESICVLSTNIDYEERQSQVLETLTKMYGLGNEYEEYERTLLLRKIQAQVSDIFTEIFSGDPSNFTTDIQLVDIERKYVSLMEELDSMPVKLVQDLKDKMISDEKKLLEEQARQARQIIEFQKLATQMARALAPPPTSQERIQRIVKSRSAPCRRVKRRVPIRSKSAANSANRQGDDEDARFLDSLLKLS